MELGINQFEELTGIRPYYGGEHPGNGTRNAIVSMANGQYLEILAPVAGLDTIPDFFSGLDQLTPVGIALLATDMPTLEIKIRELGFATDGITPGSRKTSAGDLLEWNILMVSKPSLFINPFFINWSADSQHPSRDQKPQCQLILMELETPHENAIFKLFETVETAPEGLHVVEGTQKLAVTINTPNGEVKFRSKDEKVR